jgi:hypothetical protein
LALAAEATMQRKTPAVVTKRICPQAPNNRFASLLQTVFGPMKWNKTFSISLAKERVYNLPLGMCMRLEFMFSSTIILVPNSLVQNINVCL